MTVPDRTSRIIEVQQSVTGANDRVADALRQTFNQHRIRVLSLVSSPGAGKTTLIEQTLYRLKACHTVLVITADPHTRLDCDRVLMAGATAGIQINTRGGCHLDARMIQQALATEPLSGLDLIIIENIGNLLCPAAWDLGQHATAVVVSLTDGPDIPLKYPEAFLTAQILVVTKQDMAPMMMARPDRLQDNARLLCPDLRICEISCKTGAGLDDWMSWLTANMLFPTASGACHA